MVKYFVGETDHCLDPGIFLKDIFIIALISHIGGVWL